MTTLGLISLSVLSVGGAVLLHAVARWWMVRRHGRRLCPGPRQRWWWRLVWMPGWLRRSMCGYNLTGAASLPGEGGIRCPECGTVHPPGTRLLGSPKRWRLTRIGLPVLLLGAAGLFAQRHMNDTFLDAVPSPVLLTVLSTLDEDTPVDVVEEVRARTARGEITSTEALALVPQLIRELRSDDVHWNAWRARDLLRQIGAPAHPLLEEALDSDDRQQRQMAAEMLRWNNPSKPSDAVLRATFEQLRDNSFMGYEGLGDAHDALCYLVNHGQRIEYLLAEGLHSDDPQQRYLSAVLVGLTMRTRLADEAAPMLIEHLHDNRIQDDAKGALVALFNLGDAAMPHLVAARADADEQAAHCIDYLFYRLATDEEREEMKRVWPPRVTTRYSDPLKLQVWDLDVPVFDNP